MLRDLQRALSRALTSDQPLDVLRREAARLSPEDRALLEPLDPDPLILASLLVRKLHFERICRGDRDAQKWFDREPQRFTELFAAYLREVPPTEFFPSGEALAFRSWCQSRKRRSEA